MMDQNQIREHMDVISSDGQHVGTVDHMDGNRIKLTKNDQTAQGKHHYLPMDWVQTVDEHVHLNQSSQQVMQNWQSE